jgi:Fur family ferric uptake transcriptional regulator
LTIARLAQQRGIRRAAMVKSSGEILWMPTLSPPPSAELVAEQIRRRGARATPARIRVLQLLRVAATALTHNEIEAALGASALDRVTLYRVLDWLVESGLAHRNTDAQRIFRFSAAVAGEHTTHIHFRCEHCGGVFCLDAAPPAAPTLPDGFSLSRMDFDLRGRCATCSAAQR